LENEKENIIQLSRNYQNATKNPRMIKKYLETKILNEIPPSELVTI
jgi:hypothetical protein